MQNLKKIQTYLNEASPFYLTTIDSNQPKCRPIALHLLQNDTLYFGVGDFKAVYKQMKQNPQVEICACKDTTFLRYYGKAVFETDNTIASTVLANAPSLQQIYNEESGYQLAIFHLTEATAEFRSMLDITESYSFA